MILIHPAGTPLGDQLAEAVAGYEIADPWQLYVVDTVTRTFVVVDGMSTDAEMADAVERMTALLAGDVTAADYEAWKRSRGQR